MTFKEFKETDMYKTAKNIEICINGKPHKVSDKMNNLLVVGTGHMANGDLLIDLVKM